ncbi:hypothetical protein Acsp06_29670 [Actinomycetospora sp. NBRC 106375]|uniref:type II toxin-antitoxin system HicA family toxin n=1 Tax=Actinomycetospora sp. NBRC 106375 TaxID=3032207 RepID=UPI0024A0BE3B|nr:type II toxin-antitoxin system HicA family toxin [Actinomycetospora sp. NBRC 106375]GLZ46782.1 hypothetical protein Acsp06_29670 [Actinomycetospora sp. NBRC 106375]
MGNEFPTIKAQRLRAILVRLCGEAIHVEGSHHTFVSRDGKTRFTFSKHDGVEVTGGTFRRILVDDVGLTLDQARHVARKGKLP